MIPTIRMAAAFAALSLATPLSAQEAGGSITGTLNLDPALWQIVDTDESGGSYWRETEAGYEVRLSAAPDATDDEGGLLITFRGEGSAAEVTAAEPKVELSREEAGEPLRAGAANTNLTLTVFSIEEGSLVVAGSLVAKLVPGGSDSIVTDIEDATTLDVNFQATLRQEGG